MVEKKPVLKAKKNEAKKSAKIWKPSMNRHYHMVKQHSSFDPYTILKFALMTEKSIRFIETQNKLVFIVHRAATKPEIKLAIETIFGHPIKTVNILIDQEAKKKAFITFTKPEAAGDIAIKLGII